MFKAIGKAVPTSRIENQEARYSFMQGCLSLGDEKLAKVLELTLEHGNNLGNWRRIFYELNLEFKVPHHAIDDALPWDFIDVGFDKQVLKKRWFSIMKR